MKRLNKILIPTDLSDHSRRAIAYGYRLAAEDKATLVVLHVANEFNTLGAVDGVRALHRQSRPGMAARSQFSAKPPST